MITNMNTRLREEMGGESTTIKKMRCHVALKLLLCLLAGALSLVGMAQPANAKASVEQTADYALGAEDVITVSVLRHPEFSGDFLIPTSGTVQLPAVGEMKLKGMTLLDVQRAVLRKLRDRLQNPEVSVTLKAPRMRRIYVLGDVKAPGVLDLKEGWGISEGLSAAGGLAQNVQSRDCTLTLERATSGEKTQMPLDAVLKGIAKDPIRLQPGDIVRIDSVSTLAVFVTGRVKLPGQVKLREDATGILEAIAQAGGIADGAGLASVRLIHSTGNQEIVDLSGAFQSGLGANSPLGTYPKLIAGDVVLVPELLDQFAVLGSVTKPGYYPIPSGRVMTVIDAVAIANGADRRGRLSRVGLIRTEGGKQTQRVLNLAHFLQTGDAKDNPKLLPGDLVFVPESGKVDLSVVLNGVSAAALLFNAVRR